jgi:hypothetical protein
MKRTIIAICVLIMTIGGAHAQDTAKAPQTLPRWQWSLAAGVSVPVGKFGSTNIQDSQAAYALAGPIIRFTLGYRIGYHWGISGFIDGQTHATNKKLIDPKLDFADPSARHFYTSNAWRLGTVMVGVFGEWPIGNGETWEWTGGLHVGGAFTAVPESSIWLGTPNSAGPSPSSGGPYPYAGGFNPGTKLEFAPGGDVQLGLRYLLTPAIYVDLKVDFAAESLHIPYRQNSLNTMVATDNYYPNGLGNASGSGSQPIWNVNGTLGLGFNF